MKMLGRSIVRGKAEGTAVVIKGPFSFLGGVDPSSGRLTIASGREGAMLKGNIFIFQRGKGSTVGSYTMMDMKRSGTLPAAIVNQNAETIVATGAVMASVPMVDGIDISFIEDGDFVKVDGDAGTVELPDVPELSVVTCVIRNGDKILILKRSDKVSTNKLKWAGVSGYIEKGETPLETAYKEMSEEVGFNEPRLIKIMPLIRVRSEGRAWNIHPFLFEVDSCEVKLDWEHTDHRWVTFEEAASFDLVRGLSNLLADVSKITD